MTRTLVSRMFLLCACVLGTLSCFRVLKSSAPVLEAASTAADQNSPLKMSLLPLLPLGTALSLEPYVEASNGARTPITDAVFTIDNPAAGRVEGSSPQVLVGLLPGVLKISARSGNHVGEWTLSITAERVAEIGLFSKLDSIPLGVAVPIDSFAVASNGRYLPHQEVVWTAGDPARLLISNQTITGLVLGETTLKGSLTAGTEQDLTIERRINVVDATPLAVEIEPAVARVPLGQTLLLHVYAVSSGGARFEVRQNAQWSGMAGTGQVSWDALRKAWVYTPTREGTEELTVTYLGASTKSILTTFSANLVSLEAGPVAPIYVGGTATFKVWGVLNNGARIDLSQVATIAVVDAAVAGISVDENGVTVSGIATGQTELAVSYGSKSARVSIGVVLPASYTSLSIRVPGGTSVPAGVPVALEALATTATGEVISVTNVVTWSVSDQNVAAVSNAFGEKGLLLVGASATAPFDVVARYPFGLNTKVTIQPSTATIQQLEVTGGSALLRGKTTLFKAYGTYSDGVRREVSAAATWRSGNSSIAVVSNATATQGLVTGVANSSGSVSTLITAQFGNLSADHSIAVLPKALESLALQPASAIIPVGIENRFQAQGIYSDLSQIDLTASVAWSATGGILQDVSPAAAGGYKAIVEGNGTVLAQYSGLPSVAAAVQVIGQGAASALVLTAPIGGENWIVGQTKKITWSSNLTGNLEIALSDDNGTSYGNILAASVPVSSGLADPGLGEFNWVVAGAAGSNYRVRLSSTALQATSQGSFSVASSGTPTPTPTATPTPTPTPTPGASITVTSPNGGESYVQSSAQTVTWTSSGVSGNVDILVSYDGGSTFPDTLVSGTANDGTQSVTLPAFVFNTYRIRVRSTSNNSTYDDSNANFAVTATPTVTVTSPNGGESYVQNSTQTVTWSSSNLTGNVDILTSFDGGGTYSALVSGTANDGTQSVTMPNSAGTMYRVRVRSSSNNAVYDDSNANFTLTVAPVSFITVSSPNGGESYVQNSSQTVTWSSSGVTGNVNIIVSIDGGTSYPTTLAINTPNDGSQTVTMPNSTGSTYRVRVVSVNDAGVFGSSAANFSLTAPVNTVTVNIPNGGESYQQNTIRIVTWTSSSNLGTVDIYVSTDGGTSYSVLSMMTPDDGTETVTMPNVTTSNALIRVWSNTSNSIVDTSDAVFSLVP